MLKFKNISVVFSLWVGLTINSHCRSRSQETQTSTQPVVQTSTSGSSPFASPSRCQSKGARSQTQLQSNGATEEISPLHTQFGNAISTSNGFLVSISTNDNAEILHIAYETGQVSSLVRYGVEQSQMQAPWLAKDDQEHPWMSTLVSGTKHSIHVGLLPKTNQPFVPIARVDHHDPASDSFALLPVSNTDAFVFWSETDTRTLRSVLHMQHVNASLHSKPTDSVPTTTTSNSQERANPFPFLDHEASEPIVVRHPTQKHAALLWISERPQLNPNSNQGADESFQQETYRWLEAVVFDLNTQKFLGQPQMLTSKQGYVHDFVATWAGDSLVTLTREEKHASIRNGDGGELWVSHHPLERSGNFHTQERKVLARKGATSSTPWIATSATENQIVAMYWTPQNTAMFVSMRVDASKKLVVEGTYPEPLLNNQRILANDGDLWLGSHLTNTSIVWEIFHCH